MDPTAKYFIGVDVGTASARVGIFDETGTLLISDVKDITINNPSPGFYEQSSQDIWNAIVTIVQKATKAIEKERIQGIGFCGTCSLVANGGSGEPVSISKNGDPKWDIVMWMDHRAGEEADFINQGGYDVLKFVGGKMSLEMQTPKLLWLKRNLPSSYEKTKEFFDLPDFLRWKATGLSKRSMCSVVCKWTHVNTPSEGNYWDSNYFRAIGLGDCLSKIGSEFCRPGEADVISPSAAKELGLPDTVKVGYSLIDAHSGVLGMMGCRSPLEPGIVDFTKRLALISGTSNCHMALSQSSFTVPGVWGPYYGVILPDLYLNEGGQSAAGKLLDHIVSMHPAYHRMMHELGSHSKILSKLEEILSKIESMEQVNPTVLTRSLHIWPDFHGNRSPLADPTLLGMMSGLTFSDSERDMAILYLATIQALSYGSLHIMNKMKSHKFQHLVICGGLSKSRFFLQTHADVLKMPVLVPKCSEPVLLGAAISAAAGKKSTVELASRMAGEADVVEPNPSNFCFHQQKFTVFMEMLSDQRKYKAMMGG